MDDNPYRAHSVLDKPGEVVGQLKLTRMYSYIFENPNWMLNILFVTVCQFIPIIGPITVLGYQFEIIQALHLNPARTYPDFDFNRFVDYLKRGLWPFLVALVVGLLMTPVILVFMGVFVGIMAFLENSRNDDTAVMIGTMVLLPLGIILYVALIMTLNVAMVPFQLRAGLMQDFMSAFNLAFARDFVSKVWKDTLLGVFFLVGTSMVAALAGMAAFCVGIYLAVAIVFLAQAHFYWQLYEVYLARGGEPITMPDVAVPLSAELRQ